MSWHKENESVTKTKMHSSLDTMIFCYGKHLDFTLFSWPSHQVYILCIYYVFFFCLFRTKYYQLQCKGRISRIKLIYILLIVCLFFMLQIIETRKKEITLQLASVLWFSCFFFFLVLRAKLKSGGGLFCKFEFCNFLIKDQK